MIIFIFPKINNFNLKIYFEIINNYYIFNYLEKKNIKPIFFKLISLIFKIWSNIFQYFCSDIYLKKNIEEREIYIWLI